MEVDATASLLRQIVNRLGEPCWIFISAVQMNQIGEFSQHVLRHLLLDDGIDNQLCVIYAFSDGKGGIFSECGPTWCHVQVEGPNFNSGDFDPRVHSWPLQFPDGLLGSGMLDYASALAVEQFKELDVAFSQKVTV